MKSLTKITLILMFVSKAFVGIGEDLENFFNKKDNVLERWQM